MLFTHTNYVNYGIWYKEKDINYFISNMVPSSSRRTTQIYQILMEFHVNEWGARLQIKVEQNVEFMMKIVLKRLIDS